MSDIQQFDEQEQEIKETVLEYAESISDSKEREEFIARLDSDKFYLSIRNALLEMSFLMSAAMMAEESEFLKLRQNLLDGSTSDTDEVERLRFFYLKKENYSHMCSLATSESHLASFNHRMLSFEEDYKKR